MTRSVFLNFKNILSALLMLCMPLLAKAQTQTGNNLQISTQVPTLIEACGSSEIFTVNIMNVSTTNTISNLRITPEFLAGLVYETGTLNSSNLSVSLGTSGVLEFVIGNSLAPGASGSFTYRMRATCQILPTLRTLFGADASRVLVNHQNRGVYQVGSTTYQDIEPSGSPSYSIAIPKLNLVASDLTRSLTLNINDIRDRKITVTNGGNGPLSAMTLSITYDEGVSLLSLKDNLGNTFSLVGSPVTVNSRTTYKVLVDNFAAASSTNPTRFELNESIELIEKIQINKCLAAGDPNGHISDYLVGWGCDQTICEDGTRNDEDNAFITILNGEPNFVTILNSKEKFNFCTPSDLPTYEFTFRNNGSGGDPLADRARDMRLIFLYDSYLADVQSVKIYDNQSSGAYHTLSFQTVNYSGPNYKQVIVDLSQILTDIDGAALGLEDLDDDGKFNDLRAGRELNIQVEYTPVCMSSHLDTCQFPSFNNWYIYTYVDHHDACESSFRGTGNWSESITFLPNTKPIIEGEVDLLENQVYTYNAQNSIEIGNNFLTNFECGAASDNFQAIVELPAGYAFNTISGTVPVTWTETAAPNTVTSLTSTLSPDGRTLTIFGGGSKGYHSFPVKIVCPDVTTESGTIKYSYFYTCAAACSTDCVTPMGCARYEIFAHCPVTHGGGGGDPSGCFRTTSLKAERLSLGKADPPQNYYSLNDWNSAAQVNASDPDLKLDRAMEFDQIKITANGLFTASGGFTASTAKVRLRFETPFFTNGNALNIFPVTTANAIVNSSAPFTLSPSDIVTTTTGSIIEMVITIPTSYHTNYADGDIVNVELFVTVPYVDPAVYGSNDFYGLFPVNKLRARHFGIAGGNEFDGCESFGDFFSIVRNRVNNSLTVSSEISCTGGPAYAARMDYYLGSFDYFPKEFRPYAYISHASTQVQSPYSVLQNNQTAYMAAAGRSPEVPIGYLFNTSTNTATLNLSGNWVVAENQSYDYMYFPIVQKCLPGGVVSQSNFDVFRFAYTNNNTIINTYKYNFPLTSNTSDATVADLTTYSEPIQNGFKKEVIWPVTLCNNTSTNSHAYNTWLSFEPMAAGIKVTKIIVNGTDLTPYKTYMNGASQITMFALGTLQRYDACKTIKVVAEYVNCVENQIDDVKMWMGWSCFGYPQNITPLELSCHNSVKNTILQLRYKTTDLLTEVRQLGDEDVNVCEEITYEVKYISTGNANLNSLNLTIKIPEVEGKQGMQYVPGSFRYDYNGQVDQVLGFDPSVTSNGENYSIDFSGTNIPPLNSNDPPGELPGIFAGNNKNVFTVRFKLKTNCDADGGLTRVLLAPKAKDNCGEDQGIGDFQFKLLFKGLNPLDETTTKLSEPTPFSSVSGTSSFTVTVKNTGTTSLYAPPLDHVKRFMKLSLPIGIDCTLPANPDEIKVENGRNVYYFEINDLAPLQSQVFVCVIQKGGYNSQTQGSSIRIKATTVMQLAAATCASQASECKLEATTSEDTKVIVIPSATCENCITTFAPKEGGKYIVSAWVRMQGVPATTLGYPQANMSLFFAGPDKLVGPLYASGLIIDGWQRMEREIEIPEGVTEIEFRFNNSGSSGNVFFDDIRIHPLNSNTKTFVYDPNSLRLAAELDENNYATFYEYDQEGGLIRVKKETERGIMTIQESRSNNVKKINDQNK